jgi:hypothetical protein
MGGTMRIKLTAVFLLLCLAFLMSTRATLGGSAMEPSKDEAFSALAQLPVEGTTVNVKIYIHSYSSEVDAQRLNGVLRDGGPAALLKALHKMKPMGRIEKEGTIGFYDFKLILSKPTATGRMIYALTDRPIGFLEAYLGTRSKDYPFGIMELELKGEDKGKQKGQGTLVYAAKIKGLNGEKLEVENLAFAPIRLLGVQQL